MLSLGGETGSSLFILPQPNTLTTIRSTLPLLRPAVYRYLVSLLPFCSANTLLPSLAALGPLESPGSLRLCMVDATADIAQQALRRFDSPSLLHHHPTASSAIIDRFERSSYICWPCATLKTYFGSGLVRSSSSQFSLSPGTVALGCCDSHRLLTTHHLRSSIFASE
ncbi:hypothetical protein BDV06DRAFT_115227 [Aspergillus oleicola]